MSGQTISTEVNEKLTAARLETSAYGRPIPVVYGTARIASVLAWLDDFKRTETVTEESSGGFLGIGEVTQKTTTNTFKAAMIMALCEGPITGIGAAWGDKNQVVFADLVAQWGYVLFSGLSPQAVWAYLTASHPDQAIPYDGIAFVANPAWPLTANGGIQNYRWEVGGFCQVGGGNLDANVADIIEDLATNARYGLAWDPSRLDVADFRTYCTAAGIFVSPAYSEQQPAREVVAQLLELALAEGVWSGGKVKVVPYATAAIVGNGASWAPPPPVFDLSDDDFVVPKDSGEPPVRMKRKAPSDVYNIVAVEYEPRYRLYVKLGVPRDVADYNTSVVTATDDALATLYGQRAMEALHFPMIRSEPLARATAQRRLQRVTSVLNQYEFRLGWRHVLLEPMDWGFITDAQLGLVQHPVRIREVSEDEYGTISVVAEDYAGDGEMTVATPGVVNPPTSSVPSRTDAPGSVEAPVIFEAPGSLASTSRAELWIAVTGADPNWGGCNIWMSTDGGTSYRKIAQQPTGSRYGALTALLAAWGSAPTLDTTHTLAVALLGARDTTLTSVTSAEASAGVTLCYVGGASREFLAFQTATLTGAAAYNLTTLARALRGSTDGSHASGAPFVRCDEALVRIPFSLGFPAGTTVYFKFTSFNLFGASEEDLADVVAYPFTFQNIGGPAGGNTTDALVIPYSFFQTIDDEPVVAAVPVAPTEVDPGLRKRAYLTGMKSARIVGHVVDAAAAGAARVEYSLNNGGSWTALATTMPVTSAGPGDSGWFALPGAAAADVLLRAMTTGGDATSSVGLSSLSLLVSSVVLP